MSQTYLRHGNMELQLMYSEGRIASEVHRLALEISNAYAGEELILLIVLKGALFFAADLARQLSLPVVMDYVRLSSYSGTGTTGQVIMTKEPEVQLEGRHILVVEDIVDTGLTLSFLLERLWARTPASIRVCTLLDNPDHRQVVVAADFIGFRHGGGFLVGYGLDIDEHLRELRAIYEIRT